MPRPNQPRSMRSEANLARRIEFEREQRGWTYESMAKRMADVGCPIQRTAIFKIEKGHPPRGISVDELVGFAAVFKVPIEDLLIPIELVHDRALHAMVERFRQHRDELDASVIGLHKSLREMRALLASGPRRKQLLDQALGFVRKLGASGVTWADLKDADDDERAARPYPEYVGTAIDRLTKAIERWSKETEEGI